MDFSQILDTKASEVEEVKNPPQGTYTFTVTKQPEFSVTRSQAYDIIEFRVAGVEAHEDVDADELADFGAPSGIRSSVRFMFNRDPDAKADNVKAQNRLKDFLQKTLVVDADEDASLREMMAQAINCHFVARLTWRADENDSSVIWIDLRDFMPVD